MYYVICGVRCSKEIAPLLKLILQTYVYLFSTHNLLSKGFCGSPKVSLFINFFEVYAAVNFINLLHTNILYKSRFGSFFYIHVTREKLQK